MNRSGFQRAVRLGARLIAFLIIVFASSQIVSSVGMADSSGGEALILTQWKFRFLPNGAFQKDAIGKMLDEEEAWKDLGENPTVPPGWNGKDEVLLKAHVPNFDSLRESEPVLVIPIIDQAAEIYSSNKLIYSYSTIGRDGRVKFIGYPLHFVSMRGVPSNSTLLFRVGSRHSNIGVYGGQLRIAPRADLVSAAYSESMRSFAIGSVIFFIGLFSIALYLWSRKDVLQLAYGVFAATIGAYVFVTADGSKLLLLNESVRFWMEMILVYVASSAYMFYFSAVFAEHDKLKAVAFATWGVTAIVVVSLGGAALGFFSLLQTLLPWQVFVLIGILFSMYYPIRLSLRGNREALLIAVGILTYAVCTVLGLLSAMTIVPREIGGLAMTFGILALAVSLGMVIFYRYHRLNLQVQSYAVELEEKNRKLTQLDKMKDDFLANTSHELRTPLVGILGLSEAVLAGAAGQINDRVKETLLLISQSGHRLTKLVNDILDFSKVKEKALVVDPKPVSVEKTIKLVLALSTPMLGKKDVMLQSAVPENLRSVLVDPSRFEQMLYNVVGNAIKFTDHGHVLVSAREEGKEIILCVEDTGIGIPEANRGTLFQSFEQGDASITRRFGGTGLGLAVTKTLVEAHGGRIWFETEVGKGTKFFIALPSSPEKPVTEEAHTLVRSTFVENTAETAAKRAVPDLETAVDATILIVDDEPVNRQVLRNQLSLRNFRVLEAASGKEALDILASGKIPDVILLDVMMPELSGYETCREIRRQHGIDSLPIIFITAKNQISNLVDGFGSGGNDYLAKPFLLNELLARVETQMKLARVSRSVHRGQLRSNAVLQATQKMMSSSEEVALFAAFAGSLGSTLSRDGNGQCRCNVYLRDYSLKLDRNHWSFTLKTTPPAGGIQMQILSYYVHDLKVGKVAEEPVAVFASSWTRKDSRLLIPLKHGDDPFGAMEIEFDELSEACPEDNFLIAALCQSLVLSLDGIRGGDSKVPVSMERLLR